MVKENNTVNNSTSQAPTSVAGAVPQDKPAASTAADAKSSTTDNSKREELTNYELSSKVVTTVSGGYGIDHLSIAVLVNRTALANPKGGSAAAQLADIEALVNSAAGLRKERGDTIKVLAADFAEAGHDLDPIPSPGILDVLMRQSGTAINALAVVIVAILLIVFGIRPLTRVLRPSDEPAAMALAAAVPVPALEAPAADIATGPQIIEARPEANLIEDVTSPPAPFAAAPPRADGRVRRGPGGDDPQAMGRPREPRLMHAPLARHLVRFERTPPAGASAAPLFAEAVPDVVEPTHDDDRRRLRGAARRRARDAARIACCRPRRTLRKGGRRACRSAWRRPWPMPPPDATRKRVPPSPPRSRTPRRRSATASPPSSRRRCGRFLADAVASRTLAALLDTVARVLADPDHPALTIRGPAARLAAVEAASWAPGSVTYEASDGDELHVHGQRDPHRDARRRGAGGARRHGRKPEHGRRRQAPRDRHHPPRRPRRSRRAPRRRLEDRFRRLHDGDDGHSFSSCG